MSVLPSGVRICAVAILISLAGTAVASATECDYSLPLSAFPICRP